MDRRGFLATGAAALATQAAAQSATPSAVAPIPTSGVVDLEAGARKALGDGPFYFVAGGAGAEWTLRENRRAFDRWVIVPEYLAGRGRPTCAPACWASTCPSRSSPPRWARRG